MGQARKLWPHVEAVDRMGGMAFLDVERAPGLCSHSGFRLPSEAEWEYAARGTTNTLTSRGDGLPDEDDLEELESWDVTDAEFFEDAEESDHACGNLFGLFAMGLVPELCADAWAVSLDGIPADGGPRPGSGSRARRGGLAGMVAPWQGGGGGRHLDLLPAFRSEASGLTAIRLVRSIG